MSSGHSTVVVEDSKNPVWKIVDEVIIAIQQLNILNSLAAPDESKRLGSAIDAERLVVLQKLAIMQIIQTLMKLPYRDTLEYLDKASIDGMPFMELLNTSVIPFSQKLALDCDKLFTDVALDNLRLPEIKSSEVNKPDFIKPFLLKIIAPVGNLTADSKTNLAAAAKTDGGFQVAANELTSIFNYIVNIIYDSRYRVLSDKVTGADRDMMALVAKVEHLEADIKKMAEAKDQTKIFSSFAQLCKEVNVHIDDANKVIKDITSKIANMFGKPESKSQKQAEKKAVMGPQIVPGKQATSGQSPAAVAVAADATIAAAAAPQTVSVSSSVSSPALAAPAASLVGSPVYKKVTTSFAPTVKLVERMRLVFNEISQHSIKMKAQIATLEESSRMQKNKKFQSTWIPTLTKTQQHLEVELQKLTASIANTEELKRNMDESIQKGFEFKSEDLAKSKVLVTDLAKSRAALLQDDVYLSAHAASKLAKYEMKLGDIAGYKAATSQLSVDIFNSELRMHSSLLNVSDTGGYADSKDESFTRLAAIINFGSYVLYQAPRNLAGRDILISGSDPLIYAELNTQFVNHLTVKIISEYIQEYVLEALRHYCMHSFDQRSIYNSLMADDKRGDLAHTTKYLNTLISRYLDGPGQPMQEETAITKAAVVWHRNFNEAKDPEELVGLAQEILARFNSELVIKSRAMKLLTMYSPSFLSIMAGLIYDRKSGNTEDTKLALKYDGLLQALGEIFVALGKLDPLNSAAIIEKAAPLMLYRNNKTHSGFSAKSVIIECLNIIANQKIEPLLLARPKVIPK